SGAHGQNIVSATPSDSNEPVMAGRSRIESGHQLMLLLNKGRAHLGLDQPAEAIDCFNQAIALEPKSAEAHFRRGTALEKMERFDEALASYDRAIALNPGLTNAYLSKGSVLNRLTRYDDALRCYEAVLHA